METRLWFDRVRTAVFQRVPDVRLFRIDDATLSFLSGTRGMVLYAVSPIAAALVASTERTIAEARCRFGEPELFPIDDLSVSVVAEAIVCALGHAIAGPGPLRAQIGPDYAFREALSVAAAGDYAVQRITFNDGTTSLSLRLTPTQVKHCYELFWVLYEQLAESGAIEADLPCVG